MKLSYAAVLYSLVVLFSVGCADTQQEIASGGAPFAGITFNGKPEWQIIAGEDTDFFYVSAECDKRVKSIEWSFDDQKTWSLLATDTKVVNKDLDCSDGSLKFDVKNRWVKQTNIDFYLRGETFAGYTRSSRVSVIVVFPTSTPTPTPTVTPTATPTVTPSPTPTPTPTVTPTPTTTGTVVSTPRVTAKTSPTDGYYKLNEVLTFSTTFDQIVIVDGSPKLVLTVDPSPVANKFAVYATGTGTHTLQFTWSVDAGSNDTNGIYVNSNIHLNEGSIQSSSGANADLTTPWWGVLGTLTGVKVDTMPPSAPTWISLFDPATSPSNDSSPQLSINGVFSIGDTVSIHTNDPNCLDSSKRGSAQAASADSSILVTADSPALPNSGSYTFTAKATDLANNASSCSSPLLTYTYDGTVPTIVGTAVPSGGSYTTSQVLTYSITFSEPITYSSFASPPRITLGFFSEGKSLPVTTVAGNVATFSYTLAATDIDSDGFSITGFAPSFTDLVGNQSGSLTLSSSNITVNANASPAVLGLTGGSSDFGTIIYSASPSATASITFNVSNNPGAGHSASSVSYSIEGDANAAYFSVSNTSFGSCATLAPGGFCYPVVTFTSPGAITITPANSIRLRVAYYDGVQTQYVYSSYLSAIGVPMGVVVTPAWPNHGANWNDYVSYSISTSPKYLQGDNECSGSESGYYGEVLGCLHGGEFRKVVVAGKSSCANLTAVDSLGAFNWICDDSGAQAKFFSTGLKPNKGLGDLIFELSGLLGSWLPNQVTIAENGRTIATSSDASWWTNHIQPLVSDTSSLTSLSDAGKIYFSQGILDTAGLLINANKVAVVTIDSGSLRYENSGLGGGNCEPSTGQSGSQGPYFICGGSKQFIWIEVTANGYDGAYQAEGGLLLYDLKFSRIHKTLVSNLSAGGGNSYDSSLYLSHSSRNLISGFDSYISTIGPKFVTSTKNIVKDMKVVKTKILSATEGLLTLEGGSDFNRFYNIGLSHSTNSTSNFSKGLYLENATNNVFQRIKVSDLSVASNTGVGIYLSSTSSSNIFVQTLGFGLSDTVFKLSSSNNNIVSHATAGNVNWNAVYFSGSGVDNNVFNSLAAINGTALISSSTGSRTGNRFVNLGLFSMRVANTVVFDPKVGFATEGYLVRGSTDKSDLWGAITVPSPNLTSAFYGPSEVNDEKNPQGSLGYSTFSSLGSINAWFDFESFFKGWGFYSTPSGWAGIATTVYQQCTTGYCRIWDWRANPAGPLYNKSFDGSNDNANLATSTDGNGVACPAATVTAAVGSIGAADFIAANSKSFLKRAIEIDGDEIGNDNGLCESGESCIYAPHIGAYQGEGSLSSGFCTVSGSGFSAVKIYKFN